MFRNNKFVKKIYYENKKLEPGHNMKRYVVVTTIFVQVTRPHRMRFEVVLVNDKVISVGWASWN